ncbi:hypothetical protein BKA83DRAFT_4130270 [Pisolithus microcarpus]|nr:hypothetical protein BKA83DRAFT_4130270 [Pisolithus microcarpus]
MTDGRMIDEETADGAELPNRVKVASTVKPVVSHYTEDPRAFIQATGQNMPRFLKGFHVERDRVKEEETYFVGIDTKLAKQPAPFIGFTQLFRYMTPLELFLDAIGVVGAKAAGVAQPRFSEG